MKKVLTYLILCLLVSISSSVSFAASRAEIAAINVVNKADFKYWNENSPTLKAITSFVENATNPQSSDYIPKEDRIVTFDLDGTLYCETAPYCFQEMMFLYRALEDDSVKLSPEAVAVAKEAKPLIMNKKGMDKTLQAHFFDELTKSYEGMTRDEYRAYVHKFMEKNVIGLSDLKRGEAYYLPMVEVVSYLNNNDFEVYLDSACEREILRCLADGVLKILTERMIGSNVAYKSTNMGNEAGDKHFYDRHSEKIVRSGRFIEENVKTNKIFSILMEIGKRPVLSFGNSMGDSGMLEYTLQNDKYKTLSFYVLCDDVKRELGNLKRAENDKKFAISRGWRTISMRDEFKTIYGDNVKRVNKN